MLSSSVSSRILIPRQILVLKSIRFCAQNVCAISKEQPKSPSPTSRESEKESNRNATWSTQRIGAKRLVRLKRKPLKSAATLTQPAKIENIDKSRAASRSEVKAAIKKIASLKKTKETPSLQGNGAKGRLSSTVPIRRVESARIRSRQSIQALESTTTQTQDDKRLKKPQAGSGEVLESHTQSSFDKLGFNNTLQKEKTQSKITKEGPDVPKEQSSVGKERAEQRWRYTSASYLGSTPKEVMQRVKELSQAGFSDEVIDLILKRFPPTLKVNSKSLYFNFNTFVEWKLQWKQILNCNPELFLLDTNHVSIYGNKVVSMVTFKCIFQLCVCVCVCVCVVCSYAKHSRQGVFCFSLCMIYPVVAGLGDLHLVQATY